MYTLWSMPNYLHNTTCTSTQIQHYVVQMISSQEQNHQKHIIKCILSKAYLFRTTTGVLLCQRENDCQPRFIQNSLLFALHFSPFCSCIRCHHRWSCEDNVHNWMFCPAVPCIRLLQSTGWWESRDCSRQHLIRYNIINKQFTISGAVHRISTHNSLSFISTCSK